MNSDLQIYSIEKIYCNTCKLSTNHELVYAHEREVIDGNINQQLTYRLWVCRGCDTATMQEELLALPGNLNEELELFYHPARSEHHLSTQIFSQLSDHLYFIYRQIIDTFNNKSYTLCAIGIRALIEGICVEKKVTGRSLYNKIEGLSTHLPPNIVSSLQQLRFMGNKAAHELNAPLESELRLAIEVMEDIISFLYELSYKAKNLHRTIGKYEKS